MRPLGVPTVLDRFIASILAPFFKRADNKKRFDAFSRSKLKSARSLASLDCSAE